MIDDVHSAALFVSEKMPHKIVLSQKALAQAAFERCGIELKEADGRLFYQLERLSKTQAFHENIETAMLASSLEHLLSDFRQLNAFYSGGECEVKISKKGKIFTSQRKTESKEIEIGSHNREKSYILPQGTPIAPLVDLGVFTPEGALVKSMTHKYRQINRFIELVDDEIKKLDKREINVIDFGCGKSYLTFILYYYLTEIRGVRANIIGLDLKADVIEKCSAISQKYGYTGLRFELGDINGYMAQCTPDMVITLHACDTATDYAIYNAVSWGAKMIFSVPCCQHEVNSQIKGGELSILTRYGIVKERTAALITDAVRANALIYSGYETQLLEFIDIAHSPKNLLIRAVKGGVSDGARKKAQSEIEGVCRAFEISPTLPQLLGMTK